MTPFGFEVKCFQWLMAGLSNFSTLSYHVKSAPATVPSSRNQPLIGNWSGVWACCSPRHSPGLETSFSWAQWPLTNRLHGETEKSNNYNLWPQHWPPSRVLSLGLEVWNDAWCFHHSVLSPQEALGCWGLSLPHTPLGPCGDKCQLSLFPTFLNHVGITKHEII